MKRMLKTAVVLVSTLVGSVVMAGEAETSATGGANALRRSGDANATASYEGRVGFARTQANSGAVNTARGVAVGVDKNGVAVSVSGVIAPRLGPAVGTSFNLAIDRDGDVSKSRSVGVARGSLEREVTVGGGAHADRRDTGATAIAGGKTGPLGRVEAESRSRSDDKPRVIRLGDDVRVLRRG